MSTIKETVDEMNMLLVTLHDQYKNVENDSDKLQTYFKTTQKLLEDMEQDSDLPKRVQEVSTLARVASHKFLDVKFTIRRWE